MTKYLKIEEVADVLAVEVSEISSWIETGQLRAIRLGTGFRVAEDDLEKFLATRVHQTAAQAEKNGDTPMNGVRLERTFAGRTQFRVSGTVKTGARVWPGKMQSGLFFSREIFERMLTKFQGKEIPAGTIFSGPEEGSLGEWIQESLPTKMNPTYCIGGLLAAEGYAERVSAGVIRFVPDALQRLRQ